MNELAGKFKIVVDLNEDLPRHYGQEWPTLITEFAKTFCEKVLANGGQLLLTVDNGEAVMQASWDATQPEPDPQKDTSHETA